MPILLRDDFDAEGSGQSGSYHDNRRAAPSTHAALVLSTVGCGWRDRD